MANWTSETVVFYQKDGGRERLKEFYQTVNSAFFAKDLVDYEKESGTNIKVERTVAEGYGKWKQDYPKTFHDLGVVSSDWIGNMLPLMDLHHWYEKRNKQTTTRSFIETLDSEGLDHAAPFGKRPNVTLVLSTAWYVVDELWDEIAKLYDLEYVQMGIGEDADFVFNTDVNHEFLDIRYFIEYYDKDGDLAETEFISNKEELLDFVDIFENVKPVMEQINERIGEKIGNLKRSSHWIKEMNKEMEVNKLVDEINEYFKIKYGGQKKRPQLECTIFDTTRNGDVIKYA